MTPFSIAVISDLHFGRCARSKDLCPHPDGPVIDERFQETFLKFVRETDLRADFLILPGDVAEIADTNEVRLASNFVLKAARALGVRRNMIVFVPGNHDVDWSVIGTGASAIGWDRRYDPIRYRDYIFRRLVGPRARNVLMDPYLALWSSGPLQVVGYNSSWHDKQDEAIHYGKIDDAHLTALEELLASVDPTDDAVRLFLVHHHPVYYDNPVPGDPDFSQMVNNERLLFLLRQYYFDFVIHGHTHQPRFHIYQRDGSIPLGILACGSFSLQLPAQWAGRVTNQFHLITVDGRNPTTRFIEGHVKSWAYYYGTGWTMSGAEHDGIAHSEPFGTYLDPHRCRAVLRPLIEARFVSSDWIEWEMLVTDDPSLAYMRPERIDLALRELSPTVGFDVHRRGGRLFLLKSS